MRPSMLFSGLCHAVRVASSDTLSGLFGYVGPLANRYKTRANVSPHESSAFTYTYSFTNIYACTRRQGERSAPNLNSNAGSIVVVFWL